MLSFLILFNPRMFHQASVNFSRTFFVCLSTTLTFKWQAICWRKNNLSKAYKHWITTNTVSPVNLWVVKLNLPFWPWGPVLESESQWELSPLKGQNRTNREKKQPEMFLFTGFHSKLAPCKSNCPKRNLKLRSHLELCTHHNLCSNIAIWVGHSWNC